MTVVPRRFVILGAGAVGGLVAASLRRAGDTVTVIARGTQLAALRESGLRLDGPDGTDVVQLDVADSPAGVGWQDDDAVILAVKSQDTQAALEVLEAYAPPSVLVICAQNGVDNERAALRRFPATLGMCVNCPATFLETGVIRVSSARPTGALDVGRYPGGSDEVVADIATRLRAAGFDSQARADVMRWKYAKLLVNLGNSVEALCGPAARGGDLSALLRQEGEACLHAAGLGFVPADEFRSRMSSLVMTRTGARDGGSSWQSMARGTGSIEADYLNGEIVLLGRLHGVPTPANALVQRRAVQAARARRRPGSVSEQELLDDLAAVA